MKYLLLNFSLLLLNTMVTSRNIFPNNITDEKYLGDPFKNLKFSFSCEGRPNGFYADIDYACKIFHVCYEDGTGRRPVLCPKNSLFDQRQRMCTDEEDVPCEQSEKWYYLDENNYYSYFMEARNKAEVILEEIDVNTFRPLEN